MTLSHDTTGNSHSPEEVPKRPKGILKNSTSFVHQQQASSPEKVAISSPPLPADPAENKEITLQNTLQNAGRRRSSSTRRTSAGRRLSGTPSAFGEQGDERSPHLKWDEANLYLTEQEKTAKMKIDEPKTPWAATYDPSQDEREEMEVEAQNHTLDANDLVVDELDQAHHKKATGALHESDIPDFELGEPEEDIHAQQQHLAGGESRITRERSLSQNSNRSDKHVVVDNDGEGVGHGEDLMSSQEAKEKHRQFEERRKRHYEMKNIKDILAHPEELDGMEDDDDENGATVEPPAVPNIAKHLT